MVYSPAARLLTALELLQARASVSATLLAERLEVNTRSVRRYVTMLQDMGIPIETVRGRYGGYRLRPGFKLPPLMLTEDEALAVTLGLLAAQRLGLASTVPAVPGALAKVERVLPLGLRERVHAVQETVALDLGAPATSAPADRHLLVFSLAAHQGRRVRLRYVVPRDGEEIETERTLDPYGLVYHQGRWYVVGYCHLRNDIRVFRLDRVRRVESLDDTFTQPAGFDCLDFAIKRFAAMPDRWLIEAILETTIEEVSRSVPPSFATLTEASAGVLLRAYDSDLDHTARFLMSLGCELTVHRPPELLEALRRLARRTERVIERFSMSGDTASSV